jgi:hypothetical protein
MLARRRSHFALLAKVVVALLVAVFAFPTIGQACCAPAAAMAMAASSAEPDDCCPSGAPAQDADCQDSSPCSCPLSCSSGCSGLGRALAVGSVWQVLPPASANVLHEFNLATDPVTPDPNDILRVPKRVTA